MPALPGQHHVARPVGEPGKAKRQQADDDQKDDDADHCETGLLSAASASAAMRWLAAIAASRACAFLTQPSASARAASGSLAISASAAALSPRAAAAMIRAVTDAASPPAGAAAVPIGVMRTSLCAWLSSRARKESSLGSASVARYRAGVSAASSRPSSAALGTPCDENGGRARVG